MPGADRQRAHITYPVIRPRSPQSFHRLSGSGRVGSGQGYRSSDRIQSEDRNGRMPLGDRIEYEQCSVEREGAGNQFSCHIAHIFLHAVYWGQVTRTGQGRLGVGCRGCAIRSAVGEMVSRLLRLSCCSARKGIFQAVLDTYLILIITLEVAPPIGHK